jgi:cytochrome c heme-lyase
VDYVIDFYSGQGDGKMDGKVNFYLDVRPKLTWEGGKMRFRRWMGDWATTQDPKDNSPRNQTN